MKDVRFIIVALVLMMRNPGLCQYISNTEFSWTMNEECHSPDAEVFKVQETLPVVPMSDESFENLVTEVEYRLSLTKDLSGTIKLLLRFNSDRTMCVYGIGLNEFKLSEGGIRMLFQLLEIRDEIVPGAQRGRTVTSEGELYLIMKRGRIKDYYIRNFALADW